MSLYARTVAVILPLLPFLPPAACPLAGAASLPCTPAGLTAAVAAGGVHEFDCDGVIQVAATLVVTNQVTLDAAGHQVTLSGGGAARLFSVEAGGSLTLLGLTLAGGSAIQGGAILNQGGTLAVTNGVFAFNAAAEGGALYNAAGGSAVFWQSQCVSNRVIGTNGANGVPGSYSVASGRPGGAVAGGAIWNNGTLQLHRSVLRWNVAVGGQGGAGTSTPTIGDIFAGQGGAGGNALGGAIQHAGGQAWLVDCTLHDNAAYGGAGGNGGLGNPGTSWPGNYGGNGGAGGFARGGGIAIGGGGVTMTNCTLAFCGVTGGQGGLGGGGGSTGRSGFDGGAGGDGGAVLGAGLATTNATVRLCQVTMAGHVLSAGSGGSGGNGGGGTLTHGNPGASGRTGGSGGSAVANLGGPAGTLGLVNTLLGPGPDPACHGVILDLGHNLCADTSCAFTAGSAEGLNPGLGALANHGGGVPTMALLEGSPAIDAADGLAAPGADARGEVRPKGATADIGAFESGFTSAGALYFSAAAYTVNESAPSVTLHVLRGGGALGAVTVTVSATAGTASNGADFVATNRVLAFAAGENSRAFTVELRDDLAEEGPETVLLALSSPGGGAVLGPTPAATLTLADDEGGRLVADCTEAALWSALARSNHVRFLCDGVIRMTAPMVVSNALILDASGREVTLSGGGSNRIFQVVAGGTLTLSNLTLAHGLATNRGGAVDLAGGALRAYGGAFRSNRVVAPANQLGHGQPAVGGAIHSSNGVITLVDVRFDANEARGGNGGLLGSAGAPQPTGGNGGEGRGGAIHVFGGSLQAHRGSFISNRAIPGAGGMGTIEQGLNGNTLGGAIFASGTVLTVSDSLLGDNFCGGGARHGTASGGALYVREGSFNLSNTLVHGNTAEGGPSVRYTGGVWGGAPASGGGLCQTGGTAVLTQAAFANNRVRGGDNATSDGPGGTNSNSAGYGLGGGITWNSTGTLALVNCTLAGNLAQGGDAIPIRNSGSAWGGALASQAGTVSLRHVSLAGNRVRRGTGGQPGSGEARGDSLFTSNAVTSLRSSLLGPPSPAGHCAGFVQDAGFNLCSDGTALLNALGSRNHTDPLLLPLGFYGGSTLCLALQAGSPAIDGATNSTCPPADQRGVLRPLGAQCDVGAFEWNPAHLVRSGPLTVRVFGQGVPSTLHLLQTATSLDNWQDGPSTVAGPDGSFQFPDQLRTPESRYFRVQPSGPPTGLE